MRGTVLVTGAHGFMGRHVARACARAGYRVRGLGHGHWAEAEWQSWGLAEWEQADLSLQTLRAYAGAPDIIFHCAGSGSVSFSAQHPELSFRNTVTSTVAVLEYVKTVSARSRVVFASSASVYGEALSLPIKESAPALPVSQYGCQKLMAEQHARAYGRECGVWCAIVRFFSVYGPGLRKQLMWDTCTKLAAGEPVFRGTGEELRDWLHVEDAALLLLTAADHAQSACPAVNGGSGAGVPVREVVTRLGTLLLGPDFAPVFSGTRLAGEPIHYVADIEASSRWDWKPTRSWADGVDEYADWWLRAKDCR